MRTISFLVTLLLTATPLTAQDRQSVFDTLYARHRGQLQGQQYAGDDSDSDVSQYWRCQTCAERQTLVIGYYDYSYTYDTTDPAQVLRMVAGACGMEDCVTENYSFMGLTGLRQEGTRRGRHRLRTVLIAGDRMVLLEARDTPTRDTARALHSEAEESLIRPLLEAAP